MDQVNDVKQSRIKFLFALFGFLSIVDVATLAYSNEYRNIFGEVRDISEVVWRIIPDIFLFLFYSLTFWKIRSGILLPRLMVWHGIIYGLIGIVMCLPWVGYFLAPFSPIGLLYLGSILWGPSGYVLSLVITSIFIAANLYLIRLGLTGRKLDK